MSHANTEGRRKPRRSLSECTTERQICELPRSVYACKGYWLLDDGYDVAIYAQKTGEQATQKIDIPRKVFRQLVAYWNRPQPVVRKVPR